MFDYDDVTQKDKNFICDLVDRTTFNNNEQIYVETKDPEMFFLMEEVRLIKQWARTSGHWGRKKMKMLAKKLNCKRVTVKVSFMKHSKKKQNLHWKSKIKDRWIQTRKRVDWKKNKKWKKINK